MDTVMDTIFFFVTSMTYKTTTTFIHEQSKLKSNFTKKGIWALFRATPRDRQPAGRNRERRAIHVACHAEINACLSATWRYERTQRLSLAQQA